MDRAFFLCLESGFDNDAIADIEKDPPIVAVDEPHLIFVDVPHTRQNHLHFGL